MLTEDGLGLVLSPPVYISSKLTLHTKAMTFDGRRAVVGSANLDQRGLHGALQNFLFNRELSLLIDDPAFTAELDRRIMQADRQQVRSWETVLQQLHDQYGGPAGLRREIEKRRGKERLY